VAAYTWQFGNGLTATLSLEDQMAHAAPVIDLGNGNAAANTNGIMGGALFAQPAIGPNDYKAGWVPDIVGNLRVDQAWGSAQIMGGLHAVGGRYYTAGALNNAAATAACNQTNNSNVTTCGHPFDQWGWAVGAGLTLKMPWDAKDTLSGVIAYGKGASRFVAFGNNMNAMHTNQTIGYGAFTDAVFGGAKDGNGVSNPSQSNLELTTTWGGTVAFEHYWTPALRTSWVFGYLGVEYNDAAKVLIGNLARRCVAAGTTLNNQNGAFCDPDWSMWRLASRTMWNPVANLDVGLEVAYTKLNTAGEGFLNITTASPNASGLARGTYAIEDQDVWSATVRVQRSFWP
jgi:hypothetical protein